jgi:hypothetical protein
MVLHVTFEHCTITCEFISIIARQIWIYLLRQHFKLDLQQILQLFAWLSSDHLGSDRLIGLM